MRTNLLLALLLSSAPLSQGASSFLIDFGPNDTTNGIVSPAAGTVVTPGNGSTGVADAHGHYWNNAIATQTLPPGGFIPASLTNLVTIDNVTTSVGVTFSGGWKANGIAHGGLLNPNAALLGDFAVKNATQDYFFVENGGGTTGTASLTFTNLDPGHSYDLALFGTRNTVSIRNTQYTVIDGKNVTRSVMLQTSGAGAGSAASPEGNDDTIVSLTGLAPDPSGRLTLTVSRVNTNSNTFGYLGIAQLTEGAPIAPAAISDVIDRWVAQDALDPVAPGAVLFVGSSTIRRWESLTRDFADYRVVQRGFGGSQFSELIPIANKIVIPYQPSAIVVWEGTNDIRVGNKSGETVFADFQTFVSTVRAQLPNVPICFLGIVPCPSFFNNPAHDPARRTANSLIANHCASNPSLNLHYIDTASFFEALHDAGTPAATAQWNSYFVDDTHLNRAGYREFLKAARPVVEAVISPNKSIGSTTSTFTHGHKLLFDFGPSDSTAGDSTIGADIRGNHWNNWHPTNGVGLINSGEHLANLVSSTGTATGIRMTIIGGFLCNGKSDAGGLFNPNAALLGDLAVETATEDFFYSSADDKTNGPSDDLPGGFMLEGLNPALSYEFRFFGSRSTTETRLTEFAVYGANQKTVNLQMSGVSIGSTGGNGNDDEVAILSGIRPDAYGQVFIDLTLLQGSFTNVNAMEVIVSNATAGLPAWREGYFSAATLSDPAMEAMVWGDEADPDADGRCNLLEYASGGNPVTIQPAIETDSPPVEEGLLSLTYQRSLVAPDLVYQVEDSTNLATWLPVADSFVSTGHGFETRRASVPIAGFEQRFLRLQVSVTTNP